ncbi:RCC1 domain-containing protein [Actinotignum timonense]|uniref:RCC1 domain-containing protein n=1 Tax=Actinotignum timonense TaxID=1870995 RepID=UPI00254CA645|nr:RCC1 domain-containing protein [Actinotignum timonense]MDK6628730.1 RCC1 domain-containing protein [Actinotignum timonense]
MIDQTVGADALYIIATTQGGVPGVLEDIATHPSAYPELAAWANFARVVGVGRAGEVPAPPQTMAQVAPEVGLPASPVAPLAGGQAGPQGVDGRRRRRTRAGSGLPGRGNLARNLTLGAALVCLALMVAALWVMKNPTGDVAAQSEPPTPAASIVPATPEATTAPPAEGVLEATGKAHMCIARGKDVSCIGVGDHGQNASHTFDADVKVLAAGGDTTCASSGQGAVCWGDNRWSQAGSQPSDTQAPAAVSGLEALEVKDVAVGDAHACALTNTGVWCWGTDYNGQLGGGAQGDKASLARQVTLPEGANPTGLVASRFATCARNDAGRAWCWGSNDKQALTNDPAGIVGVTEKSGL